MMSSVVSGGGRATTSSVKVIGGGVTAYDDMLLQHLEEAEIFLTSHCIQSSFLCGHLTQDDCLCAWGSEIGCSLPKNF